MSPARDPSSAVNSTVGKDAQRKLISIVTPAFNEEENVEMLHAAVTEVMAAEADRYDLEMIFTDNHSTDRTYEKLLDLAKRDNRVRAYRFSRNFGYQRSIYTGLTLARGDAAVELDCDLQDPPTLIRDFLRLWEQGYHVVYGIRRSRKEGISITLVRRFFYWLVDRLCDYHLPQGAGDFRLIDRRILEQLRKIQDPNIYLRGRIAALGFKQAGIEYDRGERKRGESKFKLRHNIQLAMDAITSHSAIPLRLASYFGFAITCLAGLGFPIYLLLYVTKWTTWPPGIATLLFVLLGTLGAFSLFLGIIGEYLGRLYEHVKLLPEPIVESCTDSVADAACGNSRGANEPNV